MIDLADAARNVSVAADAAALTMKEVTNAMDKLAELMRGFKPRLPAEGEFVRITNPLDQNCGELAEILWVDNVDRPGLISIHIKLSPFGGGVKMQRDIDPGCFQILTPLEVIAEAARK